jgi:hypothetical protein
VGGEGQFGKGAENLGGGYVDSGCHAAVSLAACACGVDVVMAADVD